VGVLLDIAYSDKKVVSVFVHFRALLQTSNRLISLSNDLQKFVLAIA
jgi:hypothetical protein